MDVNIFSFHPKKFNFTAIHFPLSLLVKHDSPLCSRCHVDCESLPFLFTHTVVPWTPSLVPITRDLLFFLPFTELYKLYATDIPRIIGLLFAASVKSVYTLCVLFPARSDMIGTICSYFFFWQKYVTFVSCVRVQSRVRSYSDSSIG